MLEILPKTKKTNGDQYLKLFMLNIFKKQIFPHQNFYTNVKITKNETNLLPSEVKKFLNIMAMEQGLYAQVMMILRKDSDNKKEK